MSTPTLEKPDGEVGPRRLGPGTTVPIVSIASISAFWRSTTVADTVLILGGSGLIGSALAMALARTGVAVIAVGGRAPPAPHPLLEFIPGRVDNEANLSDLVSRSTKVVHMATASTPGASIARPMHEIDANLRLTAMLLECLHRNEGRELDRKSTRLNSSH